MTHVCDTWYVTFKDDSKVLGLHSNKSAYVIRAGQYKMNPTALILSAVLMLDHLGETAAAKRLENAVATVIEEGKSVTYDMKPNRDDPTAVGTSQFADAVIAAMPGVGAGA